MLSFAKFEGGCAGPAVKGSIDAILNETTLEDILAGIIPLDDETLLRAEARARAMKKL